ncbi:phytoene desaturase family protein [Corynebacterium heidelbergense]|nr:phytoene desaturase family protein [Corynebacterium heidelbergense]
MAPRTRKSHLDLVRPSIPMTRATKRQLVPGKTDHVVIVGAGLAGLTAAIRVRATGRDVTVIDSESTVGGRCRTEWLTSGHGRYAADTGATVFTMPSLVESAIASVGLRPQDLAEDLPEGWGLHKLSPAYRAEFASGRVLGVYSNPDRMLSEIRRFASDHYSAADVERIQQGYLHHRDWAAELFASSFENFLAADFDSPLDLLSTPASASDLGHLLSLGAFGSLGRKTEKQVIDHELARVLSFQALYAGVAPRKALAVYAVIAHMDTSMGVYYPRFGIGDVPDLMAAAARKVGVSFQMEREVASFTFDGDHITAVNLSDGETIPADAVIATPDLPVMEKLLNASRPGAADGTGRLSRLARRYRRPKMNWSPSAVVIHGTIPTATADAWAGQQEATQADGHSGMHHTISFGHAWDQTFREITGKNPSKRGELMSDPSLLVTRPAASAPARRQTTDSGMRYEPISVLAPAPNLTKAPLDWDAITDPYTEEILGLLEQRGFAGLASDISIARVDTPATWLGMGHGAGTPFALAHTFTQTGPFRPRNYPAYGIDNLVMAGSSTTPGVGVPTTILSGALAARRIGGGGVK